MGAKTLRSKILENLKEKIGTDQKDDQLIFEDKEHPLRTVGGGLTEDERFLIIGMSEGTSGEEAESSPEGMSGIWFWPSAENLRISSRDPWSCWAACLIFCANRCCSVPSGRSDIKKSAYPMIEARELLKSWIRERVTRPSAAIFCKCGSSDVLISGLFDKAKFERF